MTVWIVTEHYNEYDQHGGYYLAAFKDKPTLEELKKVTGYDHIGRRKDEYTWIELEKDEVN